MAAHTAHWPLGLSRNIRVIECIADASEHLKASGAVGVADRDKLTQHPGALRVRNSHQVAHQLLTLIRAVVLSEVPEPTERHSVKGEGNRRLATRRDQSSNLST